MFVLVARRGRQRHPWPDRTYRAHAPHEPGEMDVALHGDLGTILEWNQGRNKKTDPPSSGLSVSVVAGAHKPPRPTFARGLDLSRCSPLTSRKRLYHGALFPESLRTVQRGMMLNEEGESNAK